MYELAIDGHKRDVSLSAMPIEQALKRIEELYAPECQNYMYTTVKYCGQVMMGYKWSKNKSSCCKRWSMAFVYDHLTGGFLDRKGQPYKPTGAEY